MIRHSRGDIRTNRSALPVLLFILIVFFSACSSPPKEPEPVFTRRNQADSMMAQGHTMTDSLQLAAARASYEGALDIYASLDDRSGTVSALLALGRNSRAAGDADSARNLYTHAEALAVQSGDARLIRDAMNHRADIALRSGDPVTAWEYLDDTTPAVTDGGIRAAQLRLMGSVKYELGSPDEANDYLSQAVNAALIADDMNEAAQAWYKMASIASLEARFDDAEALALKALEADKSGEYGPGIAADLRALAIINTKSGDIVEAEDYYRRAWLALRALGRTDDAEEARSELEKMTGEPVVVP